MTRGRLLSSGRGPGNARGSSLLEVLITLVLLTIGLLGIAGMQAVSLKNAGNAYLRTESSILAGDMLDRLRANRPAAEADDYDIDFGASAPSSPETVAEADLSQWKQRLAEALPAGEGRVAVADPGTGQVEATVAVRWTEREEVSLPWIDCFSVNQDDCDTGCSTVCRIEVVNGQIKLHKKRRCSFCVRTAL